MVTSLQKPIRALPHSPPYMMHKFWARRPHNVFSQLITHYTKSGDIILDPFCGGGVTTVEGLQLKRKVIGVDLNPLATYVTQMEVTPVNLDNLFLEYEALAQKVSAEILQLYTTHCRNCGEEATCDWFEWKDQKPVKLAYICPSCGTKAEVDPSQKDKSLVMAIDRDFEQIVNTKGLWFPRDEIPEGDKTSGLINSGITHFHQLFTKRNLLALSILWANINNIPDNECRNFLRFTFSSALKWASRQSHRRGNIIEGWAMHAYWMYPIELEINVWNTFARRFVAVSRGKRFTNLTIGDYYRSAKTCEDLINNEATCLLLTQSSTSLPIGNDMVDAVITDPPYGGNVNYGELADYWSIWHCFGNKGIINKSKEVIINQHQQKSLFDYENLLEQVFSECYRVLKPGGVTVVTFNNKDLGVVSAFIDAVIKAGFNLHPEGLLYQPPIKAYTTTFHAKDLGAFTGDFIFTLCKENHHPRNKLVADHNSIRRKVEHVIEEFLHDYQIHRHTQADLRQRLYRVLLPFLADYAYNSNETYWEVVQELRRQLNSVEKVLPEISKWCRNRYKY